jgi:hypothetical protein
VETKEFGKKAVGGGKQKLKSRQGVLLKQKVEIG